MSTGAPNILQWLFYILPVTKMGLMTMKMNPDSSWHHRTEPTLGDPSPAASVLYSKLTDSGGTITCDMRNGGR